jgi:hypothetical protein
MAQPRKPEQTPVEQPGDDVGQPYRGGHPGDGGPDAKPEGDVENPEDTIREPTPSPGDRMDIERPADDAKRTLS